MYRSRRVQASSSLRLRFRPSCSRCFRFRPSYSRRFWASCSRRFESDILRQTILHKGGFHIRRLPRTCPLIWSDHVPQSSTSRFRTAFHLISELIPPLLGLEHQLHCHSELQQDSDDEPPNPSNECCFDTCVAGPESLSNDYGPLENGKTILARYITTFFHFRFIIVYIYLRQRC